MRTLVLGCFVVLAGCYLNHGRDAVDAAAADAADVAAADVAMTDAAGLACRFSFEHAGREVGCAIEESAPAPCDVAAQCVCRAWSPEGTPEEIATCVVDELTPRGAITLADLCTVAPPARWSMTDALRGYLPERTGTPLRTSEGCDSMAAVMGRR